jgi:hypothetical protein
MLGESLFKFVMSSLPILPKQGDFKAIADALTERADERFWQNEINNRIVFLKTVREQLRHTKMPSFKRRRALKALDNSLSRLVGEGGLRAEDLTSWVQAWLRDLHQWSTRELSTKKSDNVFEAMALLGFQNEYTYNSGTTPTTLGVAAPVDTSQADIVAARPDEIHSAYSGHTFTARSNEALRGLQYTKIIQDYLAARNLDLGHIAKGANQLRFDRPVVTLTDSKPILTVGIMVAYGETVETVSKSVSDIIADNATGAPLQVIIWVYATKDTPGAELENYRNILIARLIHMTTGTNIRLRSNTVTGNDQNIDQVIGATLVNMTLAYWKCKIPLNHCVFVVNSRNELLRWGTFGQFLRNEHKLPTTSFSKHLSEITSRKSKYSQLPLPITSEDDREAIAQSRARLLATIPSKFSLPHVQTSPTASLAKHMRQAGLSWVQLDDLAYNINFCDPRGEDLIVNKEKVACVPTLYVNNLPSTQHAVAQEIISRARKETKKVTCLVIIYAGTDESWKTIEEYRSEIMDIVTSRSLASEGLTYASLTYRLSPGEDMRSFKLRTVAVAEYMQWLQNHKQKPQIEWGKQLTP